jgi:ribosome modulation factor
MSDDLPRHVRPTLINVQRAFENDEPRVLHTILEDIQPVVDAAIAWGLRKMKRAEAAIDALQARIRAQGEEIESLRSERADLLADADASQHWQTRALRAEAALEEARVEHASAFDRHAAETFEKVAALQAALEEATALTTAWNDGASAQTAGLDRDACPYPPDSDLGGTWLGGWTADAWQPGGRWHVDPAEDLRRHEATTRALSVAEDLVSRAIANAGHHRARPLCSHVSHMFAIGATRAQDLCRAHGYDPDQEVGPSKRPRRTT